MTLDELNVKDMAIIKKISCNDALKNRFYSLGIVKNSQIQIEKMTLTKSTIEIKINKTKVALRLKEASSIEVELCQ